MISSEQILYGVAAIAVVVAILWLYVMFAPDYYEDAE